MRVETQRRADGQIQARQRGRQVGDRTAAPAVPGTSRGSAVACVTRRSKSTGATRGGWAGLSTPAPAFGSLSLWSRCSSLPSPASSLPLISFFSHSLPPAGQPEAAAAVWPSCAATTAESPRQQSPGRGGGRHSNSGEKRPRQTQAGQRRGRGGPGIGRGADRAARWPMAATRGACVDDAGSAQPGSSAEAGVRQGELAAHLAASLAVPWCCSGMAVASGSCGVATTSRGGSCGA